MQGAVSTTYVGLLYEFLARRGLDTQAVLAEPAPLAGSGLARVPVVHWAALLGRAQQALGEPALGLAVGAQIAPAHFGLLGYLTLCCANLGEALMRLRDYQRLVYDVNAGQLRMEADAVVLEWGDEAGRPGQLVDECALAALVGYARNITALPQAAPLAVRFINPAPASVAPYEAFFGCPVAFDAPTTIVRLPLALLARPLRQHDDALRELLEAQARELLGRLPPKDPLEAELRQAIASLLPEGGATLAACARRMGSSARTLQRRLGATGTRFQAVLDRTRQQLVEPYLADPRLKLAEIALLLGYADQAAFTRAFQRWKGTTPGQWRSRDRPA
jgi:AraC-like DNA-binding protein